MLHRSGFEAGDQKAAGPCRSRISQGRSRDRHPRHRRSSGATLALLLLGPALCSLPGCATIGHSFPPDPVQQIRKGDSKSKLLGVFGEPYRRGIEDGDSTWTYLHYKVRLFGEHLRTRDLYVRFDADGKVASYTYNSNMED